MQVTLRISNIKFLTSEMPKKHDSENNTKTDQEKE